MTSRILITTPIFPPLNSGLGNAVQQIAKLVRGQGWDVVVATSGDKRGQFIDLSSGALVEQFNISGADSWAQPLRGDIKGYVEFLKSGHFDIILMNAWQIWSTDLVMSNLDDIRGKKLLYSHCVSTNSFVGPISLRSFFRYLAWRPYWLSMRNKLIGLDGIIFLSDHGCDARFDDLKLAKRLKIERIIIPNSLSSSANLSLNTPKKNFQNRNGILSVGAYDWQKGQDFVLRAYAHSDARNKVHINFYGQKFTPFTQNLRDLAFNLGLNANYVHFNEGLNQESLIDKYRDACLFVYGSHTECQPLVLLDAMATGTPFISRASGSIPYMHGGMAVESDAEASRLINLLLSNQQMWDRLSDAGQREASEAHAPEKVQNSLMECLLKYRN